MSEMNLDGSEAAPTAAHILGDAPTEGAEAQAVTAGAGHGQHQAQETNASPEDTTSWSDLGTDDLHGDDVVVAPPATTTQPAPALSELAAERDALRERLLAVTAERDVLRERLLAVTAERELRPRLPAEYVVVRADEALRTVHVLRRYGSFTAAQDLRLRLGAFDDTDWLVAGLAAERDPDAPLRDIQAWLPASDCFSPGTWSDTKHMSSVLQTDSLTRFSLMEADEAEDASTRAVDSTSR